MRKLIIHPLFWIGLLLAILALTSGMYMFNQVKRHELKKRQEFHGTLLSTPREIPPFNLEGMDNKLFNNRALHGKWTMIFFGFTHCGYVCPTTMAKLAKTYHLLEAKKHYPLPHVVFISIDPKRDTKARLSKYVKAFHPSFYAARGKDDQIKAMTQKMGIAYASVALKGQPNNYDIQHTGAIMLINPDGKLIAFFTAPHDSAKLAQDYELVAW